MSKPLPEVGRVVVSRAGRDRGRTAIIVGIIDDNYVLVADGTMRQLASPKKKKLKHLDVKPTLLAGIQEKLLAGKPVFDSEIRKQVDALSQIKPGEEE